MERFQGLPHDGGASPDSAENPRVSPLLIAAGATIAVCLMSPALQLVTGDDTWYALPLLTALIVVWWRARLSPWNMGFRRARGFYARATLLPLVVVGGAVWLSTLVGVSRVGDVPIRLLGLQVATMAVLTALGTIFTEDGFFRGALWGTLEKAGRSTDAILLWTSTAYTAWLLPVIVAMPSPIEGVEAVLVRALNVWLLALCWGVLRLVSGSVFVAAWSHGLWNGLAYTLYGFGPAVGAIAVTDPLRFDPERGWVGVALNAAALLVLMRWWKRKEAHDAAVAAEEAEVASRDAADPVRSEASTEPRGPDR